MTVSYTSLRDDLEQLAVGGEGTVYRLRTRPTLVFKEYKAAQLPGLNIDALNGLVAFPEQLSRLSEPDATRLRDRTIWPADLVMNGPNVVGFVMQAIDASFYRTYGLRSKPKQVLCDWNQIVYQNGPLPGHIVSEVPVLSMAERVELVRDLAKTVEMLHRHDIVIGDMSGKNLVWGTNPARVIVIDCDSFRFEGTRGVCIHKESPGWIDPTLSGAPTSKVSDIYKLGVAAFRALWKIPDGQVTSQVVTTTPRGEVPEALASLVAASVSNSGRPTAAEWVKALERMFRYGKRPTLAVGSPLAAPPVPVDPSGQISRPPRPRINLSRSAS